MDTQYDQLPPQPPQQPVVPPPAPQPEVTPPTTPPPAQIPSDPQQATFRISKKLILLVGIAVLLIVVAVLVILFASQYHKQQPQNTGILLNAQEQKKIEEKYKGKDKSADNSYMAQALLTWVDKQKMSDGRYANSLVCSSNSQCQSQVADNRLGPQIAWAKFKYYQKHPSPALLNEINADISIYTNKKIVPVVQNNFWNCKLMYEMWQSNIFSPQQKQQIQKLCTRSDQYPLMGTNTSSSVSDAEIIPLMQDLESNTPSLPPVETPNTDTFTPIVTGVSDLVTMAIWEKRDSLYTAALSYFKQSLNDYKQDPKDLKDGAPLLGVAALDLYKKSKNSAYLAFAKDIYNKNNDELCDTLDYCINAMFLAQDLNEVTNNKIYSYFIANVLRHMGQTEFDGNGAFGGKQFGIGAFYIQGTHATYPVLENDMLLGIYSSQ